MSDLFVPVRMPVEYRANQGMTDAALEKINQATQKPLTSADVTIFSACMATTALTDYATRLGESTLKNFAADATEGRAYLREHRAYDGVYGYTFAGRYDAHSKRALGNVYIVKTAPDPAVAVKRQQEAADIETGLRREVSVGFGGAETLFKCDLCGNNIFSGDCPHLLGRLLEGVLQTATVENGHLMELSGVYKGACPGAAVEKATRMFRAQQFSAKEYRGWLDQMEVADPTRTLITPSDNSPSSNTEQGKKETKPMRDKLAAALTRCGLTALAVAVLGAKDDEEAVAKELSAQVGKEVETQLAAHPLLKQLSAAGISDEAGLKVMLQQAQDGQTYAASVQDTLEQEAIRNFGAEKGKEFAAAYAHLPLEQREKTAQTWKQEADKRFGIQQPTGQRTSVGTVALAADTNNAETRTQWEQLTDAERAHAKTMGQDKDEKKQEAYAANVIKNRVA